jgi:hypothetical protein
MKNVPKSLSNVVTSLANRRLLRVASYGRVRGLQQKPPLTPGKGKGEARGGGRERARASTSIGCLPDFYYYEK